MLDKCSKKHRVEYVNSEKSKQWQKEYRKTHPNKEYQKKYHHELNKTLEFKEKRRKYNKVYFLSPQFKKLNRAAKKRYLMSLKGQIKCMEYHLKRRAAEMNIVEKFTSQEWLQMKEATKGICPCCNKHRGLKNITLDHIYAVSLAYKDFLRTGVKKIYTIKDIQPLCKKCNASKHINII